MWDSILQEGSNTRSKVLQGCWEIIPSKMSGNQGRLMILSQFRLGRTMQGNKRVTQKAYFPTSCNPAPHQTILTNLDQLTQPNLHRVRKRQYETLQKYTSISSKLKSMVMTWKNVTMKPVSSQTRLFRILSHSKTGEITKPCSHQERRKLGGYTQQESVTKNFRFQTAPSPSCERAPHDRCHA